LAEAGVPGVGSGAWAVRWGTLMVRRTWKSTMASSEVTSGLEVDEAGEFAWVMDGWEEKGSEDNLGPREAHDDVGGLDAEPGEGS